MPRRIKTGHKTGPPTRTMVLATREQVLEMYTQGKTPEEIARRLQLLPATIERHIAGALDALVRHWAKPSPQHTFVRYAAFQLGIIKKLQAAHDSFMGSEEGKQYGAAVSALRVQSDIMDKVMDKGAEFGVITTRRADSSINMSQTDLRQELKNEIAIMVSLLDKIDTHDTFKARRAAQLKRTNCKPRYLVKIRKVKRDPLGFVTILPDWKFRKQAHKDAGGFIPQHTSTPEQRAILTRQTTTQIDISLLDADAFEQQQHDKLVREYEASQKRKAQAIDTTSTTTAISKPKKILPGYDIPTDYNREP